MNGSKLASPQLFFEKTRCHRRMACYSWSLLLLCICLCSKRTWYESPPGRHKAAAHSASLLLPHKVPLLQICIYSYQEVMPADGLTAAHATPGEDTPARPPGLRARKATMKRSEQGTRTPPEAGRTRSKQLKHHPYCVQRQAFSVYFFPHSWALSKGGSSVSKQT